MRTMNVREPCSRATEIIEPCLIALSFVGALSFVDALSFIGSLSSFGDLLRLLND